MPGTAWKRSLENPNQYEALKRKGYDKSSAAAISNASANKSKRKTRKSHRK